MRARRVTRMLVATAGLVGVAVLVAACTVGPNFVRPTPQTPAHWSDRAIAPPAQTNRPATLTNQPPALTDQPSAAPSSEPPPVSHVTEQSNELRGWWSGFNDPMLSSLIDRAVSSNLDLRTAMLRIEEALGPDAAYPGRAVFRA